VSSTPSGATTLDEYRKHIEKDAALERRFQPIMSTSGVEETILRSCAGSACVRALTKHHPRPDHGLRSSPRRRSPTATITERFLPEGNRLVDEAIPDAVSWRRSASGDLAEIGVSTRQDRTDA